VATDDTVNTSEDSPITIPVLANDADPDGDALTVTAVTQPANGSVTINANGTITYSPAAGYHGPDSFTYAIGDGRGGADTATVNVSVTPVNDVPMAQDDAYATNEDMPLAISPAGVLTNDSDPDGDPLTAVLVDAPTKGALTLNADGSFNYVPHANANGTDSFTYIARDGSADSAPATVTFTIRPVNDAPGFAKGPDQTVPEDAGTQSVSGWATGISAGPPDEAGQALQFLVSTNNAALFSVLPAIGPDGTLTYTPAANAFGSATITVTLRDDGGTEFGGIDTSAAQTFTIAVTPRPDVADTTINNGDVQRSRVTEIAVTFDMAVDPALLAGAFTLTRSSDGLRVGSIHVTTTVQDGRTTARLTFSGTGTQAGSLADGLWTLKVSAAFLSADYNLGLHRLFGDADGDRDVDSADEIKFNAAFGKKSNQIGYLSYFDFDQDVNKQGLRDIDQKDRTQFRQRLGSSI
jgi:VCBS repeat-containing protein